MTNSLPASFREKLKEQSVRDDLGKKLFEAKKNRQNEIRVSYGNGNEVNGHITIGAIPHDKQTKCKKRQLKRSKVLPVLKQYVKSGHQKFISDNNVKGNQLSKSHYILYKERLCDLKAVVRVLFKPKPREGIGKTESVAAAVHNLGFTYVRFHNSTAKGSNIIHLMEIGERDGLRYGRKGEGENHKRLRKWVLENPGKVMKDLDGVETETEVELLSGDRVDVVYRNSGTTAVIEVKSRDSNWNDLRRGIYQCIKYEAVMRAQLRADNDEKRSVCTLLVTECKLPANLRRLADDLKIKCEVFRPN